MHQPLQQPQQQQQQPQQSQHSFTASPVQGHYSSSGGNTSQTQMFLQRFKKDEREIAGYKCMKCLKLGHYTYECKNSAAYMISTNSKQISKEAVVLNPASTAISRVKGDGEGGGEKKGSSKRKRRTVHVRPPLPPQLQGENIDAKSLGHFNSRSPSSTSSHLSSNPSSFFTAADLNLQERKRVMIECANIQQDDKTTAAVAEIMQLGASIGPSSSTAADKEQQSQAHQQSFLTRNSHVLVEEGDHNNYSNHSNHSHHHNSQSNHHIGLLHLNNSSHHHLSQQQRSRRDSRISDCEDQQRQPFISGIICGGDHQVSSSQSATTMHLQQQPSHEDTFISNQMK